jgi:hypothetical protein
MNYEHTPCVPADPYEFEIVADRIEIGSGLIGLAQRERAFVWHMHVMPEDGCSIVKSVLPRVSRFRACLHQS